MNVWLRWAVINYIIAGLFGIFSESRYSAIPNFAIATVFLVLSIRTV